MAEYFAKCWLCSKGFPSSVDLREHLQSVHHESAAAIADAMAAVQHHQQQIQQRSPSSVASSNNNNEPVPPITSSAALSATPPPPPALLAHKPKQHVCQQCSAIFNERDELERHELTHSPTAQVVIR